MWRRHEDDKSSPAQGPAPGASPEARPAQGAYLSPAIRVKGEITGREDLYINGVLQGTVRMEGARITVGPGARVLADLDAEQILVLGQVEGNLRARTRIEIRATGVVQGDLWTARLVVAEGAVLCGKVEMIREGEAAARARSASASAGAETPPGHEP